MPSYLGALRPLLLLLIVGYAVAADLNNYAEFQVDDDITSISNSHSDDGNILEATSVPSSYVIPHFPTNLYNPILKLPKDGLNIVRAEGWQEILSNKAYVLISWMYSGV